MGKIKVLNIARLRVASYVGFLRSVLEIVRAANGLTDSEKFLALVDEFSSEFEVLEEVVRRQQALLLTPEVEEADRLRDNTLKQLKLMLQGAAYSSDEVEKDAAKKLNVVLKPYASDYRDQLSDETEDLRGLLTQLNTPEIAAYVDRLMLQPILQRLEAQNNTFEELYQKRAMDRLQTRGFGINTTSQRFVTDELYRRLIEHINSLVNISELDIVGNFNPDVAKQAATNINSLVKQYKSNLEHQNKKMKNNDETSTNP